MPLQWNRDRNPYIHSCFGRLRLGPNAKKTVIVEQARNLAKQVAAGHGVILAGIDLDEHAVNDAASRLQDAATLGHELLLTHSQPARDKKRLNKVVDDIRTMATLPEDPSLPELQHALSLFWFVRAPGPDAAELPPLEAFGLVQAGDDQDSALDVVFDA